MVIASIFSLHQYLVNASLPIVSNATTSHLTFYHINTNGNYYNNIHNNNDNFQRSHSVIPIFEIVLGTITYIAIILMTVVGNSLVVVAVFSYRPLKKVQNYFLVSLAASDLCVAMFVMPLHVVKFLAGGRWILGMRMCQLFTTADILLCTSSILNLCAIALDRYWAIHDPINYAQKRTLQFVCISIALVWLASICISVPPLIGWNDWSSENLKTHCELTTQKAFVVYSASGSFFVPLCLMIIVYVKIFLSARQRIRTNRGRSALLRINRLAPQERDISNNQNHSPLSVSHQNETQKISSNARHDATVHAAKITHININANTNSTKKITSEYIPLVVSDCRTSAADDHMTDADANFIGSRLRIDGTSSERHDSFINKQCGSSMSGTKNDKQYEHSTNSVLRSREKISVAKEKRAAKTIAVIIFVFSFCWLPFFCSYVILPFCSSCSLHPKVEQAFVWLGYINSSLNPFLYGILNLEFRRAFKKILCPKLVMQQ